MFQFTITKVKQRLKNLMMENKHLIKIPVTFSYKEKGKDRVSTIVADSVSGVIPAHSSTYYCKFYLGMDKDDPRKRNLIGEVAKSKLTPASQKLYSKLFGRPYLAKVFERDKVEIREIYNWYDKFDSSEETLKCIYQISEMDESQAWIESHEGFIILHTLNNDDIKVEGETFEKCMRLLFGPGISIKIITYETITHTLDVQEKY